jgi:hypothetical protein
VDAYYAHGLIHARNALAPTTTLTEVSALTAAPLCQTVYNVQALAAVLSVLMINTL